jgi:hypothetical protein
MVLCVDSCETLRCRKVCCCIARSGILAECDTTVRAPSCMHLVDKIPNVEFDAWHWRNPLRQVSPPLRYTRSARSSEVSAHAPQDDSHRFSSNLSLGPCLGAMQREVTAVTAVTAMTADASHGASRSSRTIRAYSAVQEAST